jgi:hypothetical protein
MFVWEASIIVGTSIICSEIGSYVDDNQMLIANFVFCTLLAICSSYYYRVFGVRFVFYLSCNYITICCFYLVFKWISCEFIWFCCFYHFVSNKNQYIYSLLFGLLVL